MQEVRGSTPLSSTNHLYNIGKMKAHTPFPLSTLYLLGPLGDKWRRLALRPYPKLLRRLLAIGPALRGGPYIYKQNQLEKGEVLRMVDFRGETLLFSCSLSSSIDRQIAIFGQWEPHIARIAALYVRPGSTVLDIGANIGYHALHFSKLVGGHGRVIAFEPAENVRPGLTRNLQLNRAKNITCDFRAVSNRTEDEVQFYQSPHANKGLGSLQMNPDITAENKQTVACVALDALALQDVSFIKMDIQGHEYQAFEGMSQLLASQKPAVIFEFEKHYHSDGDAAAARYGRFFSELGYSLYLIQGEHLLPCQEAVGEGDILAIAL